MLLSLIIRCARSAVDLPDTRQQSYRLVPLIRIAISRLEQIRYVQMGSTL